MRKEEGDLVLVYCLRYSPSLSLFLIQSGFMCTRTLCLHGPTIKVHITVDVSIVVFACKVVVVVRYIDVFMNCINGKMSFEFQSL